jgi:hypothetical protein
MQALWRRRASDNRSMRRFLLPLTAVSVFGLGACSPALDWREFQPEGSGIVATFPCKPDRHVRTVKLAVQTVRMEMLACGADDAQFALSFFDLDDPAKVSTALAELQTLAAGNLGASRRESQPAEVPGMTPNSQAAKLRLEGRQPDGMVLQEEAVFFAKGLRVYQATVLGRRLRPGAAETFIAGLRLPA